MSIFHSNEKKIEQYDNVIEGTNNFRNWINSHDKINVTDSECDKFMKIYNLGKNYIIHLLIIEYDNDKRYNYGTLFYENNEDTYSDNNDPIYVSFGLTYDSTDGEYRSHIVHFPSLYKYYIDNSLLFASSDKITQEIISSNQLKLLEINMSSGKITENQNGINVVIFNILLNIYSDTINKNFYDSRTNLIFVNIIKFINNKLLRNNIISFPNKICSKTVPIKKICDFNKNESIELDINKRVTKLVNNEVATMFSTFISWTIIHPTTKKYYNNVKICNIIENDNISELVVETNNDIKNRSYEFVSEKNIDSYFSIFFINTYVGNALIEINKFTSYTLDISNIFEIMYGLYVLHQKCNIIHGDINLTNLTFLETEGSGINVYIMSKKGQDDTFVFKNNKLSCYIIDFGKSITGSNFFKNSLSKQSNLYTVSQKNTISNFLHKNTAISYAENYEELFSALCFMDYIDLGNCLITLFNVIDPTLVLFIEDMIKESKRLFEENLYINQSKYIPEELHEINLFRNLFDKYKYVSEYSGYYPINTVQNINIPVDLDDSDYTYIKC